MKQKVGLGERLRSRIQTIKDGKYEDLDAKYKIKVTEWALDHRYPPQHVYKWIADVVVPDYETMLRLAQDLETDPGWLHYGLRAHAATASPPQRAPSRKRQKAARTISGGSDGPPRLGVVQVVENVCLFSDAVVSALRRLVRPMHFTWALA